MCHLSELRENPQTNDKPKVKEREKSAKQSKKLCKLCTLRDELNSFERLLFNKVIDKETNQTDGLSMPAPEIALIKTILAFGKSSHRRTEELRLLDKQLESIDCLQATIYKKWIKFWIEIEYTVKAYDELDMCKMRHIAKRMKPKLSEETCDARSQLLRVPWKDFFRNTRISK